MLSLVKTSIAGLLALLGGIFYFRGRKVKTLKNETKELNEDIDQLDIALKQTTQAFKEMKHAQEIKTSVRDMSPLQRRKLLQQYTKN